MTRTIGDVTTLRGLRASDHVCWHVDDPDSAIRLGEEFVTEGIEANERVFVFGPHGGTWHQAFGSDRVALLDPHRDVLEGGPLQPAVMYAMFRRAAEEARAGGYSNIRILADMDWMLARRPAEDELLAFELVLDEIVVETGAVVVCAYRSATFSCDEISTLGCLHPTWLGPHRPGAFRLWSSGRGRWHVAGEVDLANAELFEQALGVLASTSRSIRLSLEDLRFIDVNGMRAIASVSRTFEGASISLVGADGTLRKSWSLLDYPKSLPSVDLA